MKTIRFNQSYIGKGERILYYLPIYTIAVPMCPLIFLDSLMMDQNVRLTHISELREKIGAKYPVQSDSPPSADFWPSAGSVINLALAASGRVLDFCEQNAATLPEDLYQNVMTKYNDVIDGINNVENAGNLITKGEDAMELAGDTAEMLTACGEAAAAIGVGFA